MSLGDLAELARELRLLGGRELLVAEEDHVVLVERRPHPGDDGVSQRDGEIDAVDLGADQRRDGAHVELGQGGHGSMVPHRVTGLNPLGDLPSPGL